MSTSPANPPLAPELPGSGATSRPSTALALLARTPALLLVVDGHGRIVEASDLWLATLDYQRLDVLGRTLADFVVGSLPGPGGRPAASELRRRVGDTLAVTLCHAPPVTAAPGELPLSTVVFSPLAVSAVALAQELGERQQRQQQTFRAAHLASIGELAAGVAHEINNPINGIINYAQLLDDHLRRYEPEQADIAARIIREAGRISRIVRNLLGFARSGGDMRVPCAVPTEVEAVLSLCRAQLRSERITLKVSFDDDPPRVMANPHQLQQVLLNLIHNARYALNEKFPGGGEEKRLEIDVHIWQEGDVECLRLTVADGGTGIPAAHCHRVMEPFFTTKPPGAGTGLGLSISRKTAAGHGGRLHIDSVEGRYTRVHIDLPTGEKRL